MIKSILKMEQRSMINYMRAFSDSKKVLYGLLIAAIALFLLPSVVSMLSFIIFSLTDENTGGFILLVSIVAVVILALLAVNSIIKEMFMDRNIQLYLTFPVSPAALFTAKFLKQWLINVVLVMLPLGLVTGITFSIKESNWLLTVTHFVYFLLLSIIVMSVAYGLVFGVTKILPANKVSEVLAFLGGISFLLVYGVLLIGSSSIGDILDFMPELAFLYSGFLYNFSLGAGVMGITVSLLMAAALFIALRSFVVMAFRSGWIGENAARKEKRNAETATSSAVKMLILKDLRLTVRDFKEWTILLPQYLLPGVMVFIIYSNPMMETGMEGNMYNAQMIAVSISGTVLISLYVGAYNTARDAAHFDFLKTLPIKAKELVRAKYLYNILTITPVYIIAALFVWLLLPVDMDTFVYSALLIILISLAIIPVGMFAGSTQPVVSSKNPTRRLDTISNVILSAVMVVLVLMISPISLLFTSGTGDLNYSLLNIILAVLLVAACLSFLLLKETKKRYDKGFNITYKD
ncbi:ABC-2 transporter permease [Salinicoccus sp. HZC-1]|uniref:ABC-2 transporter permease n=1 Tax=Salinicoccus sp. HZC-1 TaxID=3385497 RepID=UPI00398B8E53